MDVRSILQVGTTDGGGGAERVMMDLHAEYLRRNLDAWVAVGRKTGDERNVVEVPNDAARSGWARALGSASARIADGGGRAARLLARGVLFASDPLRFSRMLSGHEDFDFPGTSRILELPPRLPDVLHLHNLHGGYFDVRALPTLTARVPSLVTMHDAWLLTGHCAHPFECEGWLTGCAECPHLDVHVRIRRDRAADNRRIKREALAASRLAYVTPSRWLMSLAERSGVLASATASAVIPNGVDTTVFSPGDRIEARAALGLDPDAEIVLLAGQSLAENPFKDFRTLAGALRQTAASRDGRLRLIALGSSAAGSEVLETLHVMHVPFVRAREVVAQYYRAADVYVHAARAENLPLAILEAMACGTPVVASSVGGVPEIIDHDVNGLLVAPGDAPALSVAISRVLDDALLRSRFAKAGLERVAERFTLEREADAYLAFYDEVVHSSMERAERPHV